MAVGEEAAAAEALVPRFKFERLLNQGTIISLHLGLKSTGDTILSVPPTSNNILLTSNM